MYLHNITQELYTYNIYTILYIHIYFVYLCQKELLNAHWRCKNSTHLFKMLYLYTQLCELPTNNTYEIYTYLLPVCSYTNKYLVISFNLHLGIEGL